MTKRRPPHRFTEHDNARIKRLRADGKTHPQVAKEMKLPFWRVSKQITHLDAMAKNPGAKIRRCIRPDCDVEFVSHSAGHRVCNFCRKNETSCEPFGNFPVVMA